MEKLNIVECRKCGASWWTASPVAGPIDGGPCCKGLPVLDTDRYQTKRAAMAAYPGMVEARDLAIASRLEELGVQS